MSIATLHAVSLKNASSTAGLQPVLPALLMRQYQYGGGGEGGGGMGGGGEGGGGLGGGEGEVHARAVSRAQIRLFCVQVVFFVDA